MMSRTSTTKSQQQRQKEPRMYGGNALIHAVLCGADGDAKCADLKLALNNCAAAAAKKGKQRSTINYHLGRLSRRILK
ncbi:hypothetical protein WJX79_007620 [Trebouxia sp. C0005]